jgi:succinate-acetate transporter protein
MTHAPTDTARGAPTPVNGQDTEFWRSHTQISLSPVAAPSILGLFGLAGATFMVAANLAGWYVNPGALLVLFPFALIFGGIAQFLAGMWGFRACGARSGSPSGSTCSWW